MSKACSEVAMIDKAELQRLAMRAVDKLIEAANDSAAVPSVRRSAAAALAYVYERVVAGTPSRSSDEVGDPTGAPATVVVIPFLTRSTVVPSVT